MKNDFREFYDEDYIIHSSMENADEEELMHGEWLNKFRRYVDKVKTASGKWRYIYPEDLKRDASYAVRNAVSKVTGKNKTFKNTARDRYNDYQNNRRPFGSDGKGKPYYTATYYNTTRNGNKKTVTATTKTNVPDYEYIQRIARSKHNVRTTAPRSQQDSNEAYQNYKIKAPNGRYYSARQDLKQTDYSKKMSEVAKKKAASSASKKQSSKIYGDYATQQKKKAAGVASRAQKAKNYSDYVTQQKKKAAGVVSRAQKAQNYSDYAEKQKKKASALALRSKNRRLNADYQKKRDMYESTYGGRKKYKKYSGSLRNR